MILFLLQTIHSLALFQIHPKIYDIQGNQIEPKEIILHPQLFLDFEAYNKKFKLFIKDSHYYSKGVILKKNICDFSISVVGDDSSYGSISICNTMEGSFFYKNFIYQIKGQKNKITIQRQEMKQKDTSKLKQNLTKNFNIEEEKKYIKVFFINDQNRVNIHLDKINEDSKEIFRNAKKFFEENSWKKFKVELQLAGIYNIVNNPTNKTYEDEIKELPVMKKILKNNTKLNFINLLGTNILENNEISDYLVNKNTQSSSNNKFEEIQIAEDLKSFSKWMSNLKNDPNNLGDLINQSNITILLREATEGQIEGLTYIGGASSFTDSFGVVNLSEKDSYFYKGKIVAHEISHSVGARHDSASGRLMSSQSNPISRENNVNFSLRSVNDIEDFISDSIFGFEKINTCGNGILDDTKECDSGLPNGSICCTADCKLRFKAECDDRNGKCCVGCKLQPAGKKCSLKPTNIHQISCYKDSVCDGKSPECKTEFLEDGTLCTQGGVCKKGVCQTRELMCERLNKRYDNRCHPKDGILRCLDDYDVCTPMLNADLDTVILPDNISCKVGNMDGILKNGKCKPKGSYGLFYIIVFLLFFLIALFLLLF